MDLYQAIYQRQCVRQFDPSRDVSDEMVKKLLEAATQAPTAGNLQPWRFWVVRDSRVKDELVQAARGQSFIAQSPVVIVICADLTIAEQGYGQRGVKLYSIQDTAAAIENLLLAVQAEGLGACWIGAFDEESVIEVLELPQAIRPMAIIPVGFPASSSHKPHRKPIDEVTNWL